MAMTSAERQAKRKAKLIALEQYRNDIELELLQIYNWSRWLADHFDDNDTFSFDEVNQRSALDDLEQLQDCVIRLASLSGYEWCNPPVNRPAMGHDKPYTLPPIHENVTHDLQLKH